MKWQACNKPATRERIEMSMGVFCYNMLILIKLTQYVNSVNSVLIICIAVERKNFQLLNEKENAVIIQFFSLNLQFCIFLPNFTVQVIIPDLVPE